MSKDPENIDEAFELIFKLSNKFKFEVLIISKQDFKDTGDCKGWTSEDYREALLQANEEICEDYFRLVNDITRGINREREERK